MASKTANTYKNYFEQWLSGIPSEIRFWDRLMETKGACLGEEAEKMFALRCSFDAPFALENELEGKDTAFLDIGSGPFSNCGVKTFKSKLAITAIDPLASAYRLLKEKHGISAPIAPQTGIVEMVDELFEENSFDIVHMSNSLDHCFDPILGIRKMLYVAKIDGKIILRHNENEAERTHYTGLHQWNVHLSETGRFLLWRPDATIDVQEALGDCIALEEARMADTKELENVWRHNYFVLRKIKPIPRQEALNGILIKRLLEQVVKLHYSECGSVV